MSMRDKSFEKFLEEELTKDPEVFIEEMQADPDYPHIQVTEAMKERLWAKLQEKSQESAREDAYSGLSEEDRKALELGRQIMARDRPGAAVAMVKRKKKKKVFVAVAAAAICTLGLGITSFGDAEKIVEDVRNTFAGRSMSSVQTDGVDAPDQDNEEEAYQKIKDMFGFDAVRMSYKPVGMKYKHFEIDENMQRAFLVYVLGNKSISYTIKANYREGSLGQDFEDNVVDEYNINLDDAVVTVKEYMVGEERSYSAEFIYQKTKYYLVAQEDKDEFEKILKNLRFF